MMRKFLAALTWILAALAAWPTRAAETPPVSQWIPRDAVAVIEVTNPKQLLDLTLNPQLMAAIKAIPPVQQQLSKPDFQQFTKLVDYLEIRLDTDWQKGLRKLLGGGVTLAALPGGTTLLVVESEDAKLLEEFHKCLLEIVKAEVDKRGRSGQVTSGEYRGLTGWTFGKNEAHAIVGNRLLVSNRPEGLKAVVDLKEAGEKAESLAALPAYQEARRAAGKDAAAVAFVNLDAVKQARALERLGQSGNPLGVLLVAGLAESLQSADWVGLGLNASDEALSVKAVAKGAQGEPAKAVAFARPKPGEGAMPNLAVPRRIAALSLYRDLREFYTAKDELFGERTSGLIFFENMMGIFFSGREMTDEVLAEAGPEIRVVVAEQAYDPAVGTPRVKVPAFALVLRMKHPEQFREVAEEAWQKALGLANFTRGQNAERGLVLDKVSQAGVTFSVARFSAVEEKDKANLDVRFNFCPALAMPDEYLILSSTEQLACDLIDALKKEKAAAAKPAIATDSVAEVDGLVSASALASNRQSLVQQNMVEKGSTQEEAQNQVDLLIRLVRWLDRAKLELGASDAETRANLEVKWAK